MSKSTLVLALLIVGVTSDVLTQAPTSPAAVGPTFEVVSIKRNTTNPLGSKVNERPDGGFTMLNIPVVLLIARAYSPAVPIEMVGLPEWARSERYDVSATSAC